MGISPDLRLSQPTKSYLGTVITKHLTKALSASPIHFHRVLRSHPLEKEESLLNIALLEQTNSRSLYQTRLPWFFQKSLVNPRQVLTRHIPMQDLLYRPI